LEDPETCTHQAAAGSEPSPPTAIPLEAALGPRVTAPASGRFGAKIDKPEGGGPREIE